MEPVVVARPLAGLFERCVPLALDREGSLSRLRSGFGFETLITRGIRPTRVLKFLDGIPAVSESGHDAGSISRSKPIG